jgi:flavin reductase (DIM6/NTAB) family NADH-FMN oxidoreductase RutF
MTLNSRGFRDALGHFATGVAVISAAGSQGAPIGVTVNSFASVSLDPPLILWSLDVGSDRYQELMKVSRFGVNILSLEEKAISQRLSRKGEMSIDTSDITMGQHDIPLLSKAIAHFECDVERRIEAGDHVIFLGRVLACSHSSHDQPLIYFRGSYRGIDG